MGYVYMGHVYCKSKSCHVTCLAGLMIRNGYWTRLWAIIDRIDPWILGSEVWGTSDLQAFPDGFCDGQVRLVCEIVVSVSFGLMLDWWSCWSFETAWNATSTDDSGSFPCWLPGLKNTNSQCPPSIQIGLCKFQRRLLCKNVFFWDVLIKNTYWFTNSKVQQSDIWLVQPVRRKTSFMCIIINFNFGLWTNVIPVCPYVVSCHHKYSVHWLRATLCNIFLALRCPL